MKVSLTSSPGLEPKTSDRWKAVVSRTQYWRSWDGEVVIFDDLSGDTLKLDPVMAEAFRRLLSGPASMSDLCDHIAAIFDLEADLKIQDWMIEAVDRFRRSGLIEPAGP